MLRAALAIGAAAAAVAPPGDQALARRLLVTARDVPGVVTAAPATGLSSCATPRHHRSAEAFGRFLYFGRTQIVSAATVYSDASDARAAASGTVKRLDSPCLARALTTAYEQQGGLKFAAGTTQVKRLARDATRIRLRFVLRDGHRTGEGVYDVVMLQRGRAVAGLAFVNPIDDAWERRIVDRVEARLP